MGVFGDRAESLADRAGERTGEDKQTDAIGEGASGVEEDQYRN